MVAILRQAGGLYKVSPDTQRRIDRAKRKSEARARAAIARGKETQKETRE